MKDNLKSVLDNLKELLVKTKRKIKKTYRKYKYMDKTKARFFMVTTVISLFCLFVGGTYAYFNISEYLDSTIITIARLKYQLTSTNTNFKNNSITVGAGETLELDLDLKSLNEFHTKYALDYFSDNPELKVYYYEKNVQNIQGEIAGLNSIINMKIVVENTSSYNDGLVQFKLKGGYLQNELSSNIIEEYRFRVQQAIYAMENNEIPLAVKSGNPNFNNSSPRIQTYKDEGFSEKQSTYNLINVDSYYTYSESYSFNPETGIYTLFNPQLCKYSECYETLENKYISKLNGSDTNEIDEDFMLRPIKVFSTSDKSFNYSHVKTSIDTFDYLDTGVYGKTDNDGISYYYRGNIDNNYVKFGKWSNSTSDVIIGYDDDSSSVLFTKKYTSLEECKSASLHCTILSRAGKDMYWRIIRINGDRSVRMIYDGTEPYLNNDLNLDRTAIFNVEYTHKMNYLFSNAKEQNEEWFSKNLLLYTNSIADEIFCNDMKLYQEEFSSESSISRAVDFNFESNVRLNLASNTYNPTFICDYERSKSSVGTDYGWGTLIYPVGLISADEVASAGHIISNEMTVKYPISNYLLKNSGYWTSTPHVDDSNTLETSYYIASPMGMSLTPPSDSISINPVINLKADVAKNMLGIGTRDNPYIVINDVDRAEVTITFDANGGSVELTQKKLYTYDEFGDLPIPVRNGYQFNGWYTDSIDGMRILASSRLTDSKDKTLYAHWLKENKITFDANGGELENPEKILITGDSYGTLPIPIRDKYKFLGWYTDPVNGIKISSTSKFTLNQDQTLYAHWNPPLTITFNSKGTNIGTKIVECDKEYGTLPTPNSISGYRFIGWFTEKEDGEKVTSDTIVSLTENHTLYAHWFKSELLKTHILNKSNPITITNYNSGNIGEMYTFSHDATAQTESLTDYRFIGKEPNNFIQFNNEIWRIIGVFTVEGTNGVKEQRVKIMRYNSIGSFPWDCKNGTGSNAWSNSSLNTMLNGDYISKGGEFTYTWHLTGSDSSNTSSIQGLNSTAVNQILLTKWYLGGSNTSEGLNGDDYYNFERGLAVYSGRSINIINKIGLIYPSDYAFTYANKVNDTCFNETSNCNSNNGGNPNTSWLYNDYMWTITALNNTDNKIYSVRSGGSIYDTSVLNYVYGNVSYYHYVKIKPCAYLRPDINVVFGSGTYKDPYIIE